jgi:hypothetical protein
MASINIAGDTSGTITLSAPLVSGSNTVTLPAATGTISLLQMGTAVASTSGTSIDFTGIPSWAKRITVMFNGVSANGSSNYLIQLGDSGGIENTGYVSGSFTASTPSTQTIGFQLVNAHVAASVFSGNVTIININSNTWNYDGVLFRTTDGYSSVSGGVKTLSDILTQIRITTVNGTDTFDAGSINVMWEG